MLIRCNRFLFNSIRKSDPYWCPVVLICGCMFSLSQHKFQTFQLMSYSTVGEPAYAKFILRHNNTKPCIRKASGEKGVKGLFVLRILSRTVQRLTITNFHPHIILLFRIFRCEIFCKKKPFTGYLLAWYLPSVIQNSDLSTDCNNTLISTCICW